MLIPDSRGLLYSSRSRRTDSRSRPTCSHNGRTCSSRSRSSRSPGRTSNLWCFSLALRSRLLLPCSLSLLQLRCVFFSLTLTLSNSSLLLTPPRRGPPTTTPLPLRLLLSPPVKSTGTASATRFAFVCSALACRLSSLPRADPRDPESLEAPQGQRRNGSNPSAPPWRVRSSRAVRTSRRPRGCSNRHTRGPAGTRVDPRATAARPAGTPRNQARVLGGAEAIAAFARADPRLSPDCAAKDALLPLALERPQRGVSLFLSAPVSVPLSLSLSFFLSHIVRTCHVT